MDLKKLSAFADGVEKLSARMDAFDHGELNIKGRLKNLDRDLDRERREREAREKSEHSARLATQRDNKQALAADLKAMLADVAFLKKMGEKLKMTPGAVKEFIRTESTASQAQIVATYKRER